MIFVVKKKLIIINGPPGIGKTSICRILHKQLNRCVWLDGDWCWMANPWIVTTETKRMAEKNMSFLLNNFLNCSEYEFVLYSWIFRSDDVFKIILDNLTSHEFKLYKFTLTCNPDVFHERLEAAGRDKNHIRKDIDSLFSCQNTESEKIDTTQRSVEEVAGILYNKILSP